jgi:hypothetical protein
VHLLETFIRNLIEDARYRKPQVYRKLQRVKDLQRKGKVGIQESSSKTDMEIEFENDDW